MRRFAGDLKGSGLSRRRRRRRRSLKRPICKWLTRSGLRRTERRGRKESSSGGSRPNARVICTQVMRGTFDCTLPHFRPFVFSLDCEFVPCAAHVVVLLILWFVLSCVLCVLGIISLLFIGFSGPLSLHSGISTG